MCDLVAVGESVEVAVGVAGVGPEEEQLVHRRHAIAVAVGVHGIP